MKKALLFVTVLFISVMTTACINNFAVQELNTKAKLYLEQGDYVAAIERLKSSIDLDDSNFETHYNLGVAYTQLEDYANAIKQYEESIKLNNEHADIYYSLAVAEENLATDLGSGLIIVDENGNLHKVEGENSVTTVEKLSDKVLELVKFYNAEAAKNYETYLEVSTKASDYDDVKAKIEQLTSENKDN